MPDSANDRQMMELAIQQAKQSKNEDKYDPFVGAVIARGGHVLATGFRGEYPNHHAEGSALKKIENDAAVGADVFTTLEPCTKRGTRTPCTDLLLKRQVGRVIIGMLDPNCDIRGEGFWRLEEANINLGRFDSDLVGQVRGMNSDFIDYQRGLGIHIQYPEENQRFDVHNISMSGIYRMLPRPGDRIAVYMRQGNVYWPQPAISFRRENGTWECGPLSLMPQKHDAHYELIVARISDDLQVLTHYYNKIHQVKDDWVGMDIQTLPSGFEVLASRRVTRAAMPA